MTEEPLVSIIVTVYNHERYVERCLRSIAEQRCSFPFEVLIGEDCSPDGSREVMRALEPELPDNFVFFYRETNMGVAANSTDLLERCRGKYFALLEGDDFWTFEGKLEAQVDFLEGHPEYSAVYHHCTVVGEDSEPNGERYPECLDEDYSFREHFLCCMPGQTGTLVARLEPYKEAKQRFLELKLYDSYAADRRNAFMFLTVGKVRCFQESWSAYRHITSGGTSHAATFSYSTDYSRNDILFGKTLCAYAERYGSEEAQWSALQTYYRSRFRWSHGPYKVERLSDVVRDVRREKRTLGLLSVPLRWYATLALRVLRGRSITLK